MFLALVPLLVWACVSDVRSRRIPNAAVAAIALTGIAASLLRPNPAFAALAAIEGAALGLVVWLPFYLLRMLGAGDVKLFAAAAAWLGPREAIDAALLTALVGGALSLALMIKDGGALLTMLRVRTALQAPATLRESSLVRTRVPYALAIGCGVLGAAYLPSII